VLQQGRDDRALGELQRDSDRSAAEALPELLRPFPNCRGTVHKNRALALLLTWDMKAHVVLLVCPIDANECREFVDLFLHILSSSRIVERDMQSRTLRSRYGEPVMRLSLSVRCGQRHTRRREVELVSIACSGLQIRRRRVHVPHPFSSSLKQWKARTEHPYQV
jgi:hypothetical protein